MKILFIPDGTKKNPYQVVLKNALEKEKIKVEIYDGKGIFKIINAIKKYKPNILHLHWVHGYIISFKKNIIISLIKGFLFLIQIFYIKFFKKLKMVWTVHNLLNHERIHWWWEFFIKFISLRFFDIYIVHCEKAKKLFIEKYKIPKKNVFKIKVIPHINYIEFYPNESSKSEARKKLGVNLEDFVFLYLGAIREYKGVLDLIKCFKKIKKSNTKLIVAGEPHTEKEKVKIEREINNIKEILYFPQFVKKEELHFFYNAADVVVLPFRDILTSGSVICAMGFKKPLILPRTGCLEEIPPQNFFYKPNDEEELKKCLEECYKKRNILHKIGMENYMWVSKWTQECIGKKHAQVYFTLLNS